MQDGDGNSPPLSAEERIRERDQKICQMYATHSAERIAHALGVSAATVSAVAQRNGLRKKRGRQPRSFDEQAFGLEHIKVGNRFAHYCTFKKKLELPEVAVELGWSPQKMSLISKGNHNLTLTDLKVMATYMELTLSELLNDI